MSNTSIKDEAEAGSGNEGVPTSSKHLQYNCRDCDIITECAVLSFNCIFVTGSFVLTCSHLRWVTAPQNVCAWPCFKTLHTQNG